VQTTTPRLTKGRKQASTPFSPTAVRLIEQIQADAQAKLLEDLSAKDSIIVLHGFDTDTKRVRASADSIVIGDYKGNYIFVSRCYVEPAKWFGGQTMIDATGKKWQHKFATMVCDDFGNLVQVAA
jgi:hypothetical protein